MRRALTLIGVLLSSSAARAANNLPDDLRVDLWQRTTVDTRWTRDDVAPALGEDVVRSWLRTSLAVAGGSASSYRYRLDVRLDLEARAKAGLVRPTWLYDAQPLAAWIDVPLGQRVRARLGEQIVTWGRMDLASAADVLDRRDLRAGPAVDPSWTRLPTPTIRIDAHLSSVLDLTLAWSVVSRPHRFELAGSSWAVLGPGILGTYDSRAALGRIAAATDGSTFTRVQDAFVQASSTPPRIDGGDLATRAVAHLGGADFALTYGYARTKLPVVLVDKALVDVLTRGDLASALSLVAALEGGRTLIETQYPRVHQVAADLEGTLGPLVVSWELGFTPRRPLYVADPSAVPRRADSGLWQTGVRAQWTRGETFALVSELDYFVATHAPPSGDPFLILGPRRALLAGTLAVREALAKHHAVEAAATVTSSGPSVLLSARYAYELGETWTIGAGATFFPRVRDVRRGDAITLADVQVGRDYVELFVRARR